MPPPALAPTDVAIGNVPADSKAPRPAAGRSRGRRPLGQQPGGRGRRLTDAFDALEAYPALAESRARLLSLCGEGQVSAAEIVAAVESDVALAIAVLRVANRVEGRRRGSIDNVVDAVEILSPSAVHGLATRARTFDFFERSGLWEAAPERFRLHAVATQRAADLLGTQVDYEDRNRLMVSSLLHDIGKLVLLRAYPGYPGQIHGDARTPEERLQRERRELGVDHALVGGVLARRWALPRPLASAIERHHADDAEGDAAIIRLADMLAHYAQSQPIAPAELLRASRAIGLPASELRGVMYDLPFAGAGGRVRQVDPCPLSARELEVLRHLAEGKVYKQIALELDLSTSTVRTHLHNIYGKLGAVDRAQAVLAASERGWL